MLDRIALDKYLTGNYREDAWDGEGEDLDPYADEDGSTEGDLTDEELEEAGFQFDPEDPLLHGADDDDFDPIAYTQFCQQQRAGVQTTIAETECDMRLSPELRTALINWMQGIHNAI